MLEMQVLTANEAAVASRVPLKQVHRIINAGLLAGAVKTGRGTWIIAAPGLLALKLAYVTADVLKPKARRRTVRRALERPGKPVIVEQAVTVEIERIKAELEQGLAELEAAKVMVASDPEVMGGTPCFAGTRIPVHDVADRLVNGEPAGVLLRHYTSLDERRIRLAPIYALAYPRRGSLAAPPWRRWPPAGLERLCHTGVKFLTDERLSPDLAKLACRCGHPGSTHVIWREPSSGKDWTIACRAVHEDSLREEGGVQAKCNEGRGPDGGRARSPQPAQSPTARPAQRGSVAISFERAGRRAST